MKSSKDTIRFETYRNAELRFGALTLPLIDYATSGLRAVTIGPSGIGKTNTGLLIAEQLAEQGWICVLMDPEGEIDALYRKRGGETMVDAMEKPSGPFFRTSFRKSVPGTYSVTKK